MKKLNRLWTAVLAVLLLLGSMAVYADDTTDNSSSSSATSSAADTDNQSSAAANTSSTAATDPVSSAASGETSGTTSGTVTLPEQGTNRYCHDFADVLTADEESKITEIAKKIKDSCELVIVTTKNGFSTSDEMELYAPPLFDKWEVGTKETEKGVLFVMDITGDYYFAVAGSGVVKYFSSSGLYNMMKSNIDKIYGEKKYGESAITFAEQIEKKLSEPLTSSTVSGTTSEAESGGVGAAIWNVIKVILIIIAIVLVLAVGFFVFLNLRAQSIRKKRGAGRRPYSASRERGSSTQSRQRPSGSSTGESRSARTTQRQSRPADRTSEKRPRHDSDNRRDL